MTKQEFKQLIEAIKKVREILTPEQALQVPFLFPDISTIDRDVQQGEIFREGLTLFEAKQLITKEDFKNIESKKLPFFKQQQNISIEPWQKVEPDKTPKEKPQPPHKK